jgi:hypothetical protein
MYVLSSSLFSQHYPNLNNLPDLSFIKDHLTNSSHPQRLTLSQQDATRLNIVNLERENKLLATAWYDLTCRLQSNTVMLARRQEPPKSWIGKQRAAVAGAGGGGVVSSPRLSG